jgi:hypothetical protein
MFTIVIPSLAQVYESGLSDKTLHVKKKNANHALFAAVFEDSLI